MFEMSLHDPFGHLKHKLWPKKKNLQENIFDVGTSIELKSFHIH
jgi:hypothetical protein